MARHSPLRSGIDYTGYEFTASAGFDYNYDPAGGRTPPNKHLDPYADEYYTSSPNTNIYASNHDKPSQTQDYERSRSPQGYNKWASRDYYYTPPPAAPRHDNHRRSGHNGPTGRKRRGSPRYDDYKDPTDDNPAPAWKPPPAPAPALAPTPAVPTPTSISDDYILESAKPSTRIADPSSSRKLLILDLNGTLVFRSPHLPREREFKPRPRRTNHNHNQDPASSPPHNPDPYADPSALRPLRTVYPRPYLAPFREYLFHPSTREWLDTMVWSSAQPHSVADMVDKCFGENKESLVAVWARDTLGLAAKDYNRKTQTTKDLAKPWAAFPLPSPNPNAHQPPTPASQTHSAHTTILLDDSPLKAHLQPYNHLCIREYVAELRNADLALHASQNAPPHEDDEGRAESPSAGGSEASESPATDGRSEPHDADPASEQHQGPEPEPDDHIPGLDRPATKKRTRRKRGKRKPRLGDATMTDESIPTPTYDQTLLAVIGILDNIKRESNVAGWMRDGGLLGKGNAGEGDQSEDGRDVKRRRIIPEEVEQWYQNPSLMTYWVSQGMNALEELAIEVVPGVEP